MAHLRNNTAAPFPVPRPTTAANMDDNETNRTQVEPSSKSRQVRWNDEMDGFMIVALVNEVLAGHKRSDNGFTAVQISKAIESVKNGCGIVVSDKNVRERLKTLKREYAEVSQLLSTSVFGWDAESGRITADSIAWDDLVKGKPDFGKWRTKLCRRYDDMECIFGNDTATGDRAVSGFDTFSPTLVDESVNEHDTPTEDTDPSPIPTRKRHVAEGTTSGRRKRTKPYDDSDRSLALIAESSKKIAEAIHMQATLDTLNHVNWQLITEKLEAMDLQLVDIMKVMKAFRSDEGPQTPPSGSGRADIGVPSRGHVRPHELTSCPLEILRSPLERTKLEGTEGPQRGQSGLTRADGVRSSGQIGPQRGPSGPLERPLRPLEQPQ
ncbi:Myb DNA-bind 3 domain-containing protein [Abeliophyllum distichum]|uniref:Myb DNA-bind 3 domain-containing protein n=1 Tax=Abeliophyllum distichum TaxID=126358 RepID=A0ABD1U146_9LAMI